MGSVEYTGKEGRSIQNGIDVVCTLSIHFIRYPGLSFGSKEEIIFNSFLREF